MVSNSLQRGRYSMMSKSYALSLLSISLLCGSLKAEEAPITLPSSIPTTTTVEPAASSFNFNLETLNTLWKTPHAQLYSALLGKTNATAEYTERLQSFLKDLGVESPVAIKKLAPSTIALTLFSFDTKSPAIVSASGIWLNEAQLSSMKEAELIFELAYAAAAYNGFSLKHSAVDTLIAGIPYSALVGINYLLYFRQSTPSKTPPSAIVNFLSSGLRILKIAALPALNAAGIALSKKMVTKPLRTFCAKAVERDIVANAASLLSNNGYAWVVEEYAELVKAALSHDGVVARMQGNLPLRDLFSTLNSVLLEHANK